MALSTQQIAGLNALNQKIAGGYTPSDIDKQNLAYATKQGYSYNPLPTGATKITDPNYLTTAGLNESQIYRSGSDIYKLPSLPQELPSDKMAGGATIPVAETTDNTAAYITSMKPTIEGAEAAIKENLAPLPSQEKKGTVYSEYEKIAGDVRTGMSADIARGQQEMDVNAITKARGENLIRMKQAEAFFNQASVAAEGRTAGASAIYGRQALLARQSAAEVGAYAALDQAYSDQITLATDTLKKSIDLKYQPETEYLENLKVQLDAIDKDLTREETAKVNALNVAINERTRLIDEKKDLEKNIGDVMLKAAQGGADAATIDLIKNSKTYGEAIINSGQYLKTETGATWDTYTDGLTGETKLINRNTGEVVSPGQSDIANGILGNDDIGYYDISSYATDPNHEINVQNALNKIGKFYTIEDIDAYIKRESPDSPVTGQMIANASEKYGVAWEMMAAIMKADSNFADPRMNDQGQISPNGARQRAYRTMNPGNVGNVDSGANVKMNSWQDGVDAVAKNLEWRKRNAPTVTKSVTEDGYDISKFTPEFYNTDRGQKVLNNEQQMFNSFKGEQIVKNYNDVQNKAASVQRIIDSGVGGPGDLALVFEFMKSLDPTSVVREAEYESAAKSGNIFAGAYAKFNGYLKEKGGFLPENVKQAFLDITNSKLGVIEGQYDNLRGEYRRIANTQGLNPENVAPNLTLPTSETQTAESAWLSSSGVSSQETTSIQEQPKTSIWNEVRSWFGLRPKPSMMETINTTLQNRK